MPNILLRKLTTKMLTAHFFIISPGYAYPMLSFSSSQCPYSTKKSTNIQGQNTVEPPSLEIFPNTGKSPEEPVWCLPLFLRGGWMDNGLIWFLPPSLGSRWSFSLVFMLAPQDMFWLCPHACAYFPWLASWKGFIFLKFPCCSDKLIIFP